VPLFGSKVQRFDGKLELKEYFNRDAGPGSYSESASTIESSLNSEMAKLTHFDRKVGQIHKCFESKAKRFIPTADMVQSDPKILAGPGSYDPQLP
jgi:hypothetical protein